MMKGKRWLSLLLAMILCFSAAASTYAAVEPNDEVQSVGAADSADAEDMKDKEGTDSETFIDVEPAGDAEESDTSVTPTEETAPTPETESEDGTAEDVIEEASGDDEISRAGEGIIINDWGTDGTTWKYYGADGTLVTGLQTIDGATYYFGTAANNRGVLLTGCHTVGSKIYYFAEKGGKPQTGLGKRASAGWITANNGNIFYANADGSLFAEGFKTIDNKIFFFQKTGAAGTQGKILTGWQKVGSKWFYMQTTGTTGTKGKIYTGFCSIGDKAYYFTPSGALGTKGSMLTCGFKKIGKYYYYFKKTGSTKGNLGSVLTGWHTIGGRVFYFKKTGAAGTKGRMFTGGFQKVGSNKYYFKKTGGTGKVGSVLTGWQKLSGKWYYFNKTGKVGRIGLMRTGFLKLGSKTYYLGTNGVMRTRWQKVSGTWYYFNSSGVMKTGWMKDGGKWYYLNTSNGKMITGWKYIGGLKYYFDSSGAMSQDVRSKVSGPYMATINRRQNVVTIYAKDGNKGYTIPVKAFTCSVGRAETPTPTGTFYTSAKYRWHTLMGPSYGQYCTRIVGGILFHSVAGSNMTSHNLSAAQYNLLGQPASHGCVRLCVRDAKWIYDNCSLQMQVTISDTAYQPFDKPATIKIPAWQDYDPTDPAV